MTMWTGNNTNMAAMGYDAQTIIKDGFAIGEEFIWKIWNYSNGEEFSTNANYLTSFNGYGVPNTGFYANNGMSAVGSFSTDLNHTIQINEGWSIISTYINPINPDMVNLMSPIVDDNNLLIIKNGVGAVYWPSFNLNTIGDISVGEGYQIKVNNNDNLTFSGELIPHDFNMQLSEGWSIISYLHQEPFNTVDMMSSIVENIDIIKNGVGAVYWPSFNLNTIGDMIPGEGYQIKMSAASTFSYPSSGGAARYGDVYVERPIHFEEPANTGNNMIIGLPLTSWESTPSIGDEIAAYGKDGELIGSTTFQGDHIALTVWGDDLTTDKKDGISEGEYISFKLWNSQTGVEQALEVRWSQGVGFYTTDGISIAGQIILGSELTTDKKLVKITDMLGREVNGDEKDVMLLYIYDDGSIERKYFKK